MASAAGCKTTHCLLTWKATKMMHPTTVPVTRAADRAWPAPSKSCCCSLSVTALTVACSRQLHKVSYQCKRMQARSLEGRECAPPPVSMSLPPLQDYHAAMGNPVVQVMQLCRLTRLNEFVR